jgi:tetratricopeptide (TPR) repeat protein
MSPRRRLIHRSLVPLVALLAVFGPKWILVAILAYPSLLRVAGVICVAVVLGYPVVSMVRAPSPRREDRDDVVLRRLRAVLLAAVALGTAVMLDVVYLQRLPMLLIASFAGLSSIAGLYCAWAEPASPLSVCAWLGHRAVEPALTVGRALGQLRAIALSILGKTSGVSKVTAGVLILFLLVLVQEWPNRYRTLILPLSVDPLVMDDHNRTSAEELGKTLASGVAREIGVLGSELRPDVLLSQGSGAVDNDLSKIVVSDPRDTIQAAVPNDTVELGPVKLPIGMLLRPAQRALELAFERQVVTGEVRCVPGGYELTVQSSQGYSTVPSESRDVRALTEKLAFAIVSSTPAWERAGMTKVPEAFAAYREGVAALRKVDFGAENTRKFDDEWFTQYRTALDLLRRATARDPKFALAHYRLAQAYGYDGEIDQAIEAYREATRANRAFAPAYNELAWTLYNYEFLTRANVPFRDRQDVASSAAKTTARKKMARDTWETVASTTQDVSVDQRARAYLGLCMFESGQPRTDPAYRDELQHGFYLCTRARNAYAAIGLQGGASEQVRPTQVAIYRQMGQILMLDKPTLAQESIALPWSCNDRMTLKAPCGTPECASWSVPRKARAADAVALLTEAHNMASNDEMVACDLALAEASDGNLASMQKLREDSRSQLSLGQLLIRKARFEEDRKRFDWADFYYQRAFGAFEAALEAEPESSGAAYQFAYLFRVWSLGDARSRMDATAYRTLATRAEKYARIAAAKAPKHDENVWSWSMYVSTLGEVLLSRGRPHEAISVLERVVDRVPRQAQYNELRWDLAQAYRCAAQEDESNMAVSHSHRALPEVQASTLEEEIRHLEARRQLQKYAVFRPSMRTCPANDSRAEPLVWTMLAVPGKPNVCSNAYVTFTTSPDSVAQLHIWNRDVDEWIDAGAQHSVVGGDYFAQLWTGPGESRQVTSAIYEFSVSDAKEDCGHALAMLEFKQAPP